MPSREGVPLSLRLGGQGELDQVLGIKASHLCYTGETLGGTLGAGTFKTEAEDPQGAETTPEEHTACTVSAGY